MRTIKFYFLVYFLVFSAVSQAQYTLNINDVDFSNGEITAYSNTIEKDIIIPDNFGGLAVTSIGNNAFNGSQLSYLSLPSSLTSIGSAAFLNNQLWHVAIPNSVTSILDKAFGNNLLSEFKLPNSYQGNIHYWSGGTNTFKNGDIVTNLFIEYTIGAKVVAIPYTLKPSDVTFLDGEITAYSNTIEKDIIIPDNFGGQSVTSIGIDAFSGSQLTSVTIPNSVTSLKIQAFAANKLHSVVIPNSVTSIDSATFASCRLHSLVIPNSVISIGNYAFTSNLLTSLVISNSVTSIGDYVFSDNLLTSVIIPNSVTSIGNNAFDNNKLTSVIIPDSVTSIGKFAFYSNKLTSVVISNSVTSIEDYVFTNNLITSVTIPNSVTSIGYYAFGDNKLMSVTIPNSVTSIGQAAFADNILTEFILPSSYQGYTHSWSSFLNDGSGNFTIPGDTYQSGNVVSDLTALYEIGSQGTIIYYNIVYNLYGGTSTNLDKYTINTLMITLVKATKENHVFVGWYSEDTFKNEVKEINTSAEGEIELFAKYVYFACPQQLYDTVRVVVHDTLVIQLSSLITTVHDPLQVTTTVKVYPNPTERELNISIDNYTNLSGVTFKVINSQSAEVHNESVIGPTQTIDVSEWSAGIYFLQVLNGTDIVDIRKIVVND